MFILILKFQLVHVYIGLYISTILLAEGVGL